MKKIFTLLTAVSIILTAGCQSAPKEEGKSSEPENTSSVSNQSSVSQEAAGETSKTFVLGLDDSFPPMGFRDENNNIVGFDIDLAKEIVADMGMELELKPIDWASKEMELNTDKIDAIWNGFTSSPERAEKMLMSKPYLKNRQIIIVPNNSDIKDAQGLSGKNVGVQAGSTSYDTLEKTPFFDSITVKEYPENVSALQDLKIGRIDALVVDEVVGRYYTAKEKDSYKVLDEVLAEEEYVIAFKLGNEELKEKLEKSFDNVISGGKAAEISKEWFGEDIIVK